MQEAIKRELNLPTMPEPPDVADALAIALCHCYLGPLSARNGVEDDPARSIRNPKSAIRNQET